jgi:hypothetical protein
MLTPRSGCLRPDVVQYRQLGVVRQSLPAVPFMALTATATPRVQKDIVANLRLDSGPRLARHVACFRPPDRQDTLAPIWLAIQDIWSLFSGQCIGSSFQLCSAVPSGSSQSMPAPATHGI